MILKLTAGQQLDIFAADYFKCTVGANCFQSELFQQHLSHSGDESVCQYTGAFKRKNTEK